KFVIVVVAIGVVMGSAVGSWLGAYVTKVYGGFYKFPLLVFVQSPDLYVAAAGGSFAAGLLGAVRALRDIAPPFPAGARRPAAGAAAAGPPALPPVAPGLARDPPCPAPAGRHDGAQHHRSSGPGDVHRIGHGARHRNARHHPVPHRHDGSTDRCDLLHVRPPG